MNQEDDNCYENNYDGGYYDEENYDESVSNEVDSKPLFLEKLVSGIRSLNDSKAMFESTVNEIINYTYLNKDEALTVLINYNWNKDNILSRWFDDVTNNRITYGIDFNSNIKLKTIENVCGVCYCNKNDKFHALSCGHLFCEDCWKDYLNFKVTDKNNCINATCMLKDCNLTVPYSFFKKYLSENEFNEYENYLLKNFTENNPDIRWCPNPKCGKFMKSKTHIARDIECECGYIFCFKCLRDGHKPCTCELIDLWERKNKSDGENVRWLQANTKKCPSCHKCIEKNQGCNHMTCRKEVQGCGYEFCWICMGEWKPHGSSYYNCTKYDPNAKVNIESDRKTKDIKAELDKYMHYYDRSFNHAKSVTIIQKLLPKIEIIIKNLHKIRNMNIDLLVFLRDAYYAVKKCHLTLKNTYVFGFFMSDKSSEQKELFEYQLKMISDNCDKLNEMIESESHIKILTDENISSDVFLVDFYKYRANCINLTEATLKFKERIVSVVENEMMDCIDYKNIKID